jgi:hypothetical protein
MMFDIFAAWERAVARFEANYAVPADLADTGDLTAVLQLLRAEIEEELHAEPASEMEAMLNNAADRLGRIL